MERRIVLYFLIILFIAYCSENSVKPTSLPNIVEQLNNIADLQVTEITAKPGFKKSFELILEQPVDHENPSGQKFYQRMYLHHIMEEAPVVFMPSGYAAHPEYIAHITSALNANQLYITHRYVGDARLEHADWQFLTIKQAAADHHLIVQLFKDVYPAKWISFGRSKDGMTALFHKRFYPEDVDATIASVAPIIRGIDDGRFDTFLDNVESEECRTRIRNYQRTILEKRDQILPLIQNFIDNSTLTYNVEPDIILEFEVCEYPFAFWQYALWPCDSIPTAEAPVANLYKHLETAGGFPLYSDEYRDFYAPLYYQAYTELGWYRLAQDHLLDLLKSEPLPSYSFFGPPNTGLTYKPEVMQDIENWLQTEGDNIIYIYGADDPWTAAAIDLSGGLTNAIKIVQERANHHITIDQLDNSELVYSALKDWLGIEINVAPNTGTNVISLTREVFPLTTLD